MSMRGGIMEASNLLQLVRVTRTEEINQAIGGIFCIERHLIIRKLRDEMKILGC